MPQLKAAKKALRKNARQRVVNDRWRSKVRKAIRAVNEAVIGKDAKVAEKALKTAQSTLDKASSHGILHKNKAARKKAQLTKAVAKSS